MNTTDIALLDALHEKFNRGKRVVVPEGYGIITATNPKLFGLFQMLYYSIYLSSTATITCYDLWLTDAQRRWCQQQDNLELLQIEEEELIFPKALSYNYWPTWNKPLYFLRSKYPKNIWIDADCVVFGDITELFSKLDQHPVIFECEIGPIKKDITKLHRLLGTNIVPHQVGPPCLNAGVLGFDTERDHLILEKWIHAIKRASEDFDILHNTPWYDQGGLQWAMEVLNLLDLISPEITWNHDKAFLPNHESPLSFIQDLPTGCKLAHFAGIDKNQIDWTEVPINVRCTSFHDFISVVSPDGRINAKFRNADEATQYANTMGYRVERTLI